MNATVESESGYVEDAEFIGIVSPDFINVETIYQTEMSTTSTGERYGHRWLLKSLPPKDKSTLALQRLRKEFEILSHLHHRNIVDAISFENVRELGPTIVMEWVEGKTLNDTLSEDNLSKKERRRLAFEIVGAVAYMHKAGIVHRDLKPSNIMVRKNGGAPVIIDFGLADTDSHTTLKHAAGTEGFMAPEAYTQHEADTRDDVYSLGIILKQLNIGMAAVIRKCLGPANKRYANAEFLLNAMLRHSAKLKAIYRISIISIIIAALVTMGVEIGYLSVQRKIDRSKMTQLQDSIEVITNHSTNTSQMISNLKDSITEINSTVEKAATRQELKDSHNAELQRVVSNGVSIIESIFKQFDTARINQLRNNDLKDSEINTLVLETVSTSINQYLEGLKTTLPKEDYNLVYRDIWEQQIRLYHEWQKNN